MSLYSRGEPVANNQFRKNTEKDSQMLNVSRIPKRKKCVRCETMRTEATGKHTKRCFVWHVRGG